MNVVNMPFAYMADPTRGRPVFNGSIYIGEPDLDPTIPANQIPVSIRQEDGTEVAVTQPIMTGAGGVPLYNGSPAVILVTENVYSIKILDNLGGEVYYQDRATGVPSFPDGGGLVQYVDTVADMKALTGLTEGVQINTYGYSVFNKGAGAYKYSLSGTANGVTVIASDTTGYFHLIHEGTVHIQQAGALEDGSTDDLAAWNLILAIPDIAIEFSGTTITSDELVIQHNNTSIIGTTKRAKIKAKNNADFENCLSATSKSGIFLHNFEIDANKANREASLTTRTICFSLFNCTDSDVVNCVARNAIGSASIPGVGFALSGVADNVNATNCIAIDCGVTGKAADGFFCSASNSVMTACKAVRCLDTGLVLESCSFSGMVGCVAIDCGVVGAITNAISSDTYGNFIDGLTGESWNATVTGGVQIAALAAGNLRDTKVDGLIMVGITQNVGPAVNIRNPSTGRVIGLDLDTRIRNATTQGVLVSGDNINIRASISGTTSACVQVQNGSTRVVVMPGSVLVGGTFGVAASGNAQVHVTASLLDGNGVGVYAFGTSIVTETWNTIINATTARIGKDAGATLNSIGHEGNALSVNNAFGAAPIGALVNKVLIYDRAGAPIGYAGIYNN